MNTVKIDPDKLDEFLTGEGLTTQELSSELGFEKDYIKSVLNGEPMALPVWKLFQVLYALDDNELSPDPDNSQRLSLSLNVMSDRVRIGLLENGVETDYAFSKIRGEREVDLIQAISYATHILYKNAEQRDLGGGSKRMMCPFRPMFSLNPVTGNCPAAAFGDCL